MFALVRSFPDRVLAFATVALATAVLVSLVGCGGKQQDDGPLLAEVGGKEIRSSYYEERLAALKFDELPKGEDGVPLDMSQPAAKREFLTTLVNKELMAMKAAQLGYANEPNVQQMRQSLLTYEAQMAMASEYVAQPTANVSFEELDAFYSRLGQVRRCKYLVTNFEKGALEARAAVEAGRDWDEVVEQYHEGAMPADGKLEISISYGRYDPDFERPIFDTPVGGISPPIPTVYGWWLVRVEGERAGDKPKLEAAKAEILDILRHREVARLQAAFRDEVSASHELYIDDEALWKVYQGLPDNEEILDPDTREPIPQETLKALVIDPADLDLVFYSYIYQGEKKIHTVGDYKSLFDRMNAFQRPKKHEMMGGLRAKLEQEIQRTLMADEGRIRGYEEKPEVVAKVDLKIEEMMVTRLYEEVVVYDEHITPEQMEAYWAEHAAEFARAEARNGFVVLTADSAAAAAARDMALAGEPWKKIINEFEVEAENRKNQGQLRNVPATSYGAVAQALFSIGEGEVSEPFRALHGRWGVVKNAAIRPGSPRDLAESREAVGRRMRMERKEVAYEKLLADWAEEFGVVRHDENLDAVRSWEEITYEEPQRAVRRNS